jgi:hypothetical protein
VKNELDSKAFDNQLAKRNKLAEKMKTLVEGMEHTEAVHLHGISEEVRGGQVGNGGRDTHPESQGLV